MSYLIFIISVAVVTGLTISIDDVVGLVIPIPILVVLNVVILPVVALTVVILPVVALTVVIAAVPVIVNIFVVPFHVNSGSSVIADAPLPINNRPAVKVLAPVPPRATVSVPSVALDTFKFVNRDPLPAIFKAVNILFVPSHDKFPDCVIGPVPFPINKRPQIIASTAKINW